MIDIKFSWLHRNSFLCSLIFQEFCNTLCRMWLLVFSDGSMYPLPRAKSEFCNSFLVGDFFCFVFLYFVAQVNYTLAGFCDTCVEFGHPPSRNIRVEEEAIL